MSRPTRFDLYRKEQAARTKSVNLIQKTAVVKFSDCWRLLRPVIERLEKVSVPLSPSDPAFWDEWTGEFTQAMDTALNVSADWIGQPITDWYEARGYEGVTHDPGRFVRAYQAQIGARDGREIKGIAETTRAWAQDKIARWYASDDDMQTLVEDLWTVFTPARARLIAITETTALSSAITYDVMRQIGLSKSIWESREDYLVCPACREMHGKVLTLNDDPPPLHPGCVLPGQIVAVPGLSHAAKSFYCGEVVEIETGGGNILAVTPNHPVLTSRGWVSAQFLHEGDYVIAHDFPERVAQSIYPDYEHVPTVVEQVFRSLKEAPFMASISVPVSPEYLHGDARLVNGNIEVVYPNRPLTVNRYSSFGNPSYQIAFNGERAGLIEETGMGLLDPFFLSDLPSLSGGMGGGNLRFPLFGGHPLPFERFGLGLIARGDGIRYENAPYHTAVNPETISEGFFRSASGVQGDDLALGQMNSSPSLYGNTSSLDGFSNGTSVAVQLARDFLAREAGFVHFDKIARITKKEFAGHVYDLQSDVYSLYICNGVIVKNCRCGLSAVDEGE